MRAENDGVGIEYEVTGEGRPVVLLHGFPDSGRLWRNQVPALAKAGFKVIVPDLRGYGSSDKPEEVEAYTIDRLVADVLAVMGDAGVERAHVVGHDWGAAVAWALATFSGDERRSPRRAVGGSPAGVPRRRVRAASRSLGTRCCSSSRASRSSG